MSRNPLCVLKIKWQRLDIYPKRKTVKAKDCSNIYVNSFNSAKQWKMGKKGIDPILITKKKAEKGSGQQIYIFIMSICREIVAQELEIIYMESHVPFLTNLSSIWYFGNLVVGSD